MRILHSTGNDELARVFVAELPSGARVELVESLQPPRPREEKWVLIVSTLEGCPVRCAFCDAGGRYRGKLSAEEILAQVEFLVRRRYPDGRVPSRMLKVQLARMGEPALNDAVLDALEALPSRIHAPGLVPSLSTVAPASREAFFERLIGVKERRYADGRFQMQFSLHTTDLAFRRRVVPVRTWSLERMAAWGDRYWRAGNRKISLNFATARGWPLEPAALVPHFSPERYLVKLTPVNPTAAARTAGLESLVDPEDAAACAGVVSRFSAYGYEVILSIGEIEENRIGSNCGMYLRDSEGYSGGPAEPEDLHAVPLLRGIPMKRTYFCPHCGATLNPNVKIVLTAIQGNERGLILLSPQPGNYKSITPPELTLEVGDLLALYCPVCNADLSTSPTMARVDFRFSTGTRGSVSFSRRYGEHATYFVTEDHVKSYGDHAEADEGTNYFGVGREVD